ncbi:actin subfamily protein [Acanthamoeba castellanii str. Neff]|uniref:Actin subfamily protein n=1 Tax=Acanthamoeba castellanii (strain ATCC 30010 / Neff) TaxID=1257118 RepID=L8GQU2_ACACF|nr:actin subfamily protein [Acanthamoeba castellanii str. Neff]ELR14501.1 actin subfamily protein [Acanthamoeba castellanii str. Neff]
MQTLVVDWGAASTKAGIAGEDAPSLIVPTSQDGGARDSSELAIEEVADLWRLVFGPQHLCVDTTEHMLITAEAALAPKIHRERCCQLAFEEFGVAGYYVGTSAVLSLYAAGRTTGIVVDCGHHSTTLAPIYEGYAFPHAIKKLPYGGIDTTKKLIDLLNDSPFRTWRRLSKTAGADLREVGKLKERVCQVALDVATERDAAHQLHARWDALHAATANEALFLSRLPKELSQIVLTNVLDGEPVGITSYTLPDGTVLRVGEEVFGCVETYFDPTYCHSTSSAQSSATVPLGRSPVIRADPSLSSTHTSASAEVSDADRVEEGPPMGLAAFVSDAIQLIDDDLRKDLYNNIVLSGMLPSLTSGVKPCL